MVDFTDHADVLPWNLQLLPQPVDLLVAECGAPPNIQDCVLGELEICVYNLYELLRYRGSRSETSRARVPDAVLKRRPGPLLGVARRRGHLLRGVADAVQVIPRFVIMPPSSCRRTGRRSDSNNITSLYLVSRLTPPEIEYRFA